MKVVEIPSDSTVTVSAADVIEALYDILLLRHADEDGMRRKLAGLSAGETNFREIIFEMIASREFAHNLPRFLEFAIDKSALKFTNDVSENGEVWQLVRMWVNAQASTGYVVDVGARGRERSNSYDLLRHFGWRGLLIEANSTLLHSIERDFAGLDFQLLCCAVSDYTGRASFTLGVNDDVSSLTPHLTENWGSVRGQVEVDVVRLSDVLARCNVPLEFDLLSLDIEGEDYKVLNDLIANSPYRPNWIIVEASSDQEIVQMLDPRFSQEVRRCYSAKFATRSNVILGRQWPERDAWTARCGTNHRIRRDTLHARGLSSREDPS